MDYTALVFAPHDTFRHKVQSVGDKLRPFTITDVFRLQPDGKFV